MERAANVETPSNGTEVRRRTYKFRWVAAISLTAVALLVANLAALIVLRSIVLSEGVLPTEAEYELGLLSDASSTYLAVNDRAFAYVPMLAIVGALSGAPATWSQYPWVRRAGVACLVLSIAIVPATIWAGLIAWTIGWG